MQVCLCVINLFDLQAGDITLPKRCSLPQQQLSSSSSLVDMLRKPFRRKSVPNSPVIGRTEDPSSGVGQPDDVVIVKIVEPTVITHAHSQSLIVPDISLTTNSVSLHSLSSVVRLLLTACCDLTITMS